MARSLWRRVLGLSDLTGAETALTALIAERRPLAPDRNELVALVEAYGLSGTAARTICTQAFARAVEAAIADAHITNEERHYLAALKQALSVSDTESHALFEAAAQPTMARAIQSALSDHLLTEEEKTELRALAANLHVSTATLTRLTQEPAQRILQQRADELLADKRLSPTEERELQELARSVGGALTIDAGTQRLLNRYRLLWQLDNGILPTIAAPIALQRGEVCHHELEVQWYEPRRVTTSVSYAGLDTSIRIARGVRFRIGNVTPVRHTTDRLTLLDTGTLYLTNKRLILRGASRNITVRLSSVLSFDAYGNGIEVQKASGRPPFLEMEPGELEVAGAVFSAILAVTND
jgi:hypothetical protein